LFQSDSAAKNSLFFHTILSAGAESTQFHKYFTQLSQLLAYIFIISPIIVISTISSHSANVSQVSTTQLHSVSVVSTVSIIFQAEIYIVPVSYNIALLSDSVKLSQVCILVVSYTLTQVWTIVPSKSVLGSNEIISLIVVSILYVYRLFQS
jgi:hypothetical protein